MATLQEAENSLDAGANAQWAKRKGGGNSVRVDSSVVYEKDQVYKKPAVS